MKILVVYGSRAGGTAEIARQIANTLREAEVTATVAPADAARDVERYDAIIVGGALYAGRWHGDARRFVYRNLAVLRARPVWFFSSGPLDASATHDVIPPVPIVRALMDFVGARDHATFGGRLAPDARGFVASKMARTRAGDWRDGGQIAQYALGIGRQLKRDAAEPRAAAKRAAPTPLPSRVRPLAQCLFAGTTALVGGAALVVWPDGSLFGMPLSVLDHSPFHDFVVPGLLLSLVVGLGNLGAAYAHAVRYDLAGLVSFVSGMALTIWTVVEMIMLRSAHPLQLVYLLLGLAIVQDGLARLRGLMPAPRPAPAHAASGG